MIIFLYGDDSYRSTRKLAAIREKFHRENDPTSTNEHVFDLADKKISFEDVYAALGSLGFFSAKRLVVVKNAFGRKNLAKELAEYLKGAPNLEDVVLAFWESGVPDKRVALWRQLYKEKFAEEFGQLKGAALIKWILDEAKKRATAAGAAGQGGDIERELAILLAQAYPADMWRLSSELDKLIAFAAGKKITKELVKGFGHTVLNTNIFDFVDALTAKNDARLAELFSNIIDAENELYVLSMMHRQFRLLWQAKRQKEKLSSSQELAKEIDVHPYVAQKLWSQAENASLTQIRRSIDHLVRAELDIKTGRSTPALALQMVLFGHN